MLLTPFGEECIACLTRGQLDVGCWLIPQPVEDFVADSPR